MECCTSYPLLNTINNKIQKIPVSFGGHISQLRLWISVTIHQRIKPCPTLLKINKAQRCNRNQIMWPAWVAMNMGLLEWRCV